MQNTILPFSKSDRKVSVESLTGTGLGLTEDMMYASMQNRKREEVDVSSPLHEVDAYRLFQQPAGRLHGCPVAA